MAETEKKKCAHPACNCIVPDNEKYCCQRCKDAKGSVEISCGCGHPGCAI